MMKTLHTILMAVALVAAPAIATAQAPVATAPTPAEAAPTPAPAPDVTPAASAAATATPAVAAVAPPAPGIQYATPDPELGQPRPAGLLPQAQATAVGEQALWMHDVVLMPVIVGITLLVMVLLFWVVVRYRAKANPVPSRTSHNTVIEVTWTLVPVIVLMLIAVPSIKLLARQYTPPPADLTVKVIGNQWYWTYEYPDNGDFTFDSNMLREKSELSPAELKKGARYRTDADGPRLLAADERMVVPVGAVVKVIVTSNDVIHSFAVPSFWTKMDAVPGRLNETWFNVEKPGIYYGQCNQLCGVNHAFMPIEVHVVSQDRFNAWLAETKTKPDIYQYSETEGTPASSVASAQH
jgi:cytochrome c oxidase subunit 2